MKRCAQCHSKLGLGVRFRNVWNGHWWVHVRFCSAVAKPFMGTSDMTLQTFLSEEEPVVSNAGFVAISITVLLASIVYELTVVSRFITEQKPKR